MRLIFKLNIFFLLLSTNLYAQTVHLSGSILDKETQVPVSNVSVFTKDHKTGTISSPKGNFSLEIPAYKANTYLYFTSVEYETDSILIPRTNVSQTIYLTPKIYSLKEVYIMPDSTLLTLLRKAYSKIPDNYPSQPTCYKGFFQESTSNEKDGLIELIEAELSVYKESYLKKREAPGQIEILKSRIKQLQSVNMGFVGGAFLPVNSDIVLQRNNYIQPQYLKYFQYDFIGIKSWNGKDCYEIEFSPLSKDSTKVRGSMLIDTETLAYISFEIFVESPENAKTVVGVTPPVESKTKVVYEQYAGKWYLKQISSKNKHENWRFKSPLYSSCDFITTQIQTDSVKPISIEKRLEYMDPIEAKAEKYNAKGWTDSDILAGENPEQLGFQFSTDEAYSIYNQNVRQKFSFTKAMVNALPKLIMGSGIRYNSAHELITDQSVLGYRFNKKWSIQGQYVEDFYNKRISLREISLGIEYRKNLNNAGYPLFLGTSFWLSDNYFHEKNYDSVREQAIVPQLSLSKRMSKFFTFELFANYPVVVHSNIDPRQNIGNCLQVGVNVYLF